ncbi:hypothetical protein SAMD00019534_096780 [Acytostelium subglobosum LB1]|uniref:hypothetical protein n=1 Tax=Acytostelium subglobosum LB1 TaxID=1410327 RepID=UPI00064505FD|nr:hypothetical protein SAMD00019534_096780 [Acytostelium subglobosum LB1]GAM26503.1 hypothetical protein SAMD00019534_096780 [Acytostelium subglobosum LB1]|eukprot:XP_012750599.1 hypothetical protein SAMD00019534_096780 [Acytostelium subglobosum LB1]
MYQKLKNIDAYPKTVDDFRIKTYAGAVVTIVSALLILWLFISQVGVYMTTEPHHELFIDTNRAEKLRINIDVIFHHLPCAYLSLDAMDVGGHHQFDVAHNIFKKRLSPDGGLLTEAPKQQPVNIKAVPNADDKAECGSCFGSKDGCCNTCDEVRDAYQHKGWSFDPTEMPQCIREGFTKAIVEQNGEGCQLYGFITVNKVAGNFHFAPGKSFQHAHMHVHDMQMFKGALNLSHTINKMSFGNPYPGIKNPLEGVVKTETTGTGVFQYYLKVVPTLYEDDNGEMFNTNQYSVTEHYKVLALKSEDINQSSGLPGVFFMYDLSPIMMKLGRKSQSFGSFITSVCAIVGGVFTVAGILDSFIYQTTKTIKRKVDLGKTS